MSADKNNETLNTVTKMLIDSQKGYEMARDMAKRDNPTAYTALANRADDRAKLVVRFQDEVRYRGETPETESGFMGEIHRAFTRFSGLFQSDTKAALEAIDDGEDHLAEQIEEILKENGLDERTHALLKTASLRAEQGEAFADRLVGAA